MFGGRYQGRLPRLVFAESTVRCGRFGVVTCRTESGVHDEILSTNATRIVVRGRVQGVGFRWWLRERARELGLSGWVRNLPDGTVEVVAAGPRAAMQRLERLVESGPPGAAVAEVVREDLTASSELPFPFTIRT